jgi:hypothetical protein
MLAFAVHRIPHTRASSAFEKANPTALGFTKWQLQNSRLSFSDRSRNQAY